MFSASLRFVKKIDFNQYVLINSESIGVEIFRLNDRSKWELTSYTTDDEIELVSIEFKFAIALLYEDVEFPPQGAQNVGT